MEDLKTKVLSIISKILSPSEQDYIITENLICDLERKIEHVLEEIKAEIPKKMKALNESIIIPACDGGKSSLSEFLREKKGNILNELLYDAYPATEPAKVLLKKVCGEVNSFSLLKSVHPKYDYSRYCLTPFQIDFLIKELEKREPDKKTEYIFFVKGFSEKDQKNCNSIFQSERSEGVIVCGASYNKEYEVAGRFKVRDGRWKAFAAVPPGGNGISFWEDRTWEDVIVLLM